MLNSSFFTTLKPRPHQQRCRSNTVEATMSKRQCRILQVERFFRQHRTLLRHCCRFRNNVKRVFREFRLLDKVEANCTCSIPLFRLCRKDEISRKTRSLDIVGKNGNYVEAAFDFVERIFRLIAFDNAASTLSLRRCCFDVVADVDGALRLNPATWGCRFGLCICPDIFWNKEPLA